MSSVKRLTFKAIEIYTEKRDKYQSKLEEQWSLLEKILQENQSLGPDTNRLTLTSIKTQVVQQYAIFDQTGSEYSPFLNWTGTEESLNDLATLTAYLSEKR